MAALTLVDKIGGYLIIDDVVWAKRGKLIEGIARLFMSSEKRYVRGFNVVVLAWTNDKGLVVPLTFRFWKPAAWYTEEEQAHHAFDGKPFRTKIELAVEMLDWAYATGFRPTAVLFDAYYLARPVLKYLARRKWRWVSRLKTNRVLHVGKLKLKPKDREAEHAAGRVSGLAKSLRAHMPGWGSVRVIASRGEGGRHAGFLGGLQPHASGSIACTATAGASSTRCSETVSNSSDSATASAALSGRRRTISPSLCSPSCSWHTRPDLQNRPLKQSSVLAIGPSPWQRRRCRPSSVISSWSGEDGARIRTPSNLQPTLRNTWAIKSTTDRIFSSLLSS